METRGSGCPKVLNIVLEREEKGFGALIKLVDLIPIVTLAL
jgi:hypothetical protein